MVETIDVAHQEPATFVEREMAANHFLAMLYDSNAVFPIHGLMYGKAQLSATATFVPSITMFQHLFRQGAIVSQDHPRRQACLDSLLHDVVNAQELVHPSVVRGRVRFSHAGQAGVTKYQHTKEGRYVPV